MDEEIITVADVVRRTSVDEELARAGYRPISKIIVTESPRDATVPYVKAQNSMGDPFYIAIDVQDSYIGHSKSDPIMQVASSPMAIPREDKEAAYAKAGMSVSGVALECKTGLCTIMHDPVMGAPREQNFVLVETTTIEEVSTGVVSYPILRLSELRSNPQACQKNIDQALRKIRNDALQRYLCKIKAVQKKFTAMADLFASTMKCKEHIVQELHRTVNLLECYLDECSKCPQDNCDKIKQIKYNLEKRNAMFPYLMECCTEIASLEDKLDASICALAKSKKRLDCKFKNLHCAYDLPEEPSSCMIKCAWDHDDVMDD